jgi:hypothetical protein
MTFHWCPHHGFWTAHKPEDCTLGAAAKADPASKAAPAAVTPKLSFAQAAAALIDGDVPKDE